MSRYNPTPVRAEYADRAERLAKKGQIGRAIRHASSKRPPGGSGPSEKALARQKYGFQGFKHQRRMKQLSDFVGGMHPFQRRVIEDHLRAMGLNLGDVAEIQQTELETMVKMRPAGEEIVVNITEELKDAQPTVPTVEMKKEQWVGAKDKAKLIGRSYTYVKDHARELGGRKNRLGRWEFPA